MRHPRQKLQFRNFVNGKRKSGQFARQFVRCSSRWFAN